MVGLCIEGTLMGIFTKGEADIRDKFVDDITTCDLHTDSAWDLFIPVSDSILRPHGKELEPPIQANH